MDDVSDPARRDTSKGTRDVDARPIIQHTTDSKCTIERTQVGFITPRHDGETARFLVDNKRKDTKILFTSRLLVDKRAGI